MRDYYQLTKPGIIYGNLLTAFAGYLLASRGHLNISRAIALAAGLGCIIGASCVYNNYIDRGIDAVMARTKRRALVEGIITGPQALSFATVLSLAGILTLSFGTNSLTLVTALFGMVAYLGLYGVGKRRTVYGTLLGSISGAVPPVVGYVAVTGRYDMAALALFIILTLWQVPHFYAIAMFRAKDYAAAQLPVLPVVAGMRAAKLQIMIYVLAFTAATSLLGWYGYCGAVYTVGMVVVGLAWFGRGLVSYKSLADVAWGRQMFFMSLIVICVWSGLVGTSYWL